MAKYLILVLAFLALPLKSEAADATGQWRLDGEGFKAQFVEMMEAELAKMPESMAAQMQPMIDAMAADMMSNMSGVATFGPDGSATFTSDDGETETGRWEDLGGDQVIIYPTEGDPIEASIDGDRMVSVMQDPESGMSLEMVFERQ